MMKKFAISAVLAVGLLPVAALAYTVQINGGTVYTVTSVSGGADSISYTGTTGGGGGGNTAPVIGQTSFTITEPSTAAATITATDPGDVITYSITGGTHASLFSIGASSGVLTFNTASTAGTYTLSVTATDDDASPLSDTDTITITVNSSGGGGGGNCGALPAGVVLETAFGLNWAISKPNSFLGLDNTDTKAMPVHTTSAPDTGKLTFAATSSPGNSSTSRTLWISECPGEPAVVPPGYVPGSAEANFFGNPCEITGVSNQNLDWSEGTLTGVAIYQKCGLAQNTDYYVNIRNNTCSSATCDIYIGYTKY